MISVRGSGANGGIAPAACPARLSCRTVSLMCTLGGDFSRASQYCIVLYAMHVGADQSGGSSATEVWRYGADDKVRATPGHGSFGAGVSSVAERTQRRALPAFCSRTRIV